MKVFLANRTSGRIIAYPAVVFLSIASFTAAALGDISSKVESFLASVK